MLFPTSVRGSFSKHYCERFYLNLNFKILSGNAHCAHFVRSVALPRQDRSAFASLRLTLFKIYGFPKRGICGIYNTINYNFSQMGLKLLTKNVIIK